MPSYRLQIRTDGDVFGHGAELRFDNLEKAVHVARDALRGRVLRDFVAAGPSYLEIVDDDDDEIVASLVINDGITRH